MPGFRRDSGWPRPWFLREFAGRRIFKNQDVLVCGREMAGTCVKFAGDKGATVTPAAGKTLIAPVDWKKLMLTKTSPDAWLASGVLAAARSA